MRSLKYQIALIAAKMTIVREAAGPIDVKAAQLATLRVELDKAKARARNAAAKRAPVRPYSTVKKTKKG